ncbi:MAG: response regulator [Elusimicrobiota bacterium]
MPNTILLVDDDVEFREEFKYFLEGYNVIEASSGKEAISILKKPNEIDLVILDVMMPGLNGIEVLKEIKQLEPGVGVIIITGYSSKDKAVEALRGKADDYLEKPVDPEKVQKIIAAALEKTLSLPDIDSMDTAGKMERVCQYIQRNAFKKISLQDVSEAVFLSPKYISRAFGKIKGMNFNEYKTKVKFNIAQKLLKKTCYNINQISDKLGFQNPESFMRMFKKMNGSTPTDFRKKLKIMKKKKVKHGKKTKK